MIDKYVMIGHVETLLQITTRHVANCDKLCVTSITHLAHIIKIQEPLTNNKFKHDFSATNNNNNNNNQKKKNKKVQT